MAELPWYEPCFSRCSTQSLRLAHTHEGGIFRTSRRNNELDIIAGVGMGRQLVWEAPEVRPGTHGGDAGSEHRPATANDLADEASQVLAAKF